MKKLFLLLIACFSLLSVHAAYLRNVPMALTQPDGSVLHCYASGDEFFNYLHDENGFTIMRHPQTGFYVYVDKQNGKLVATEFVVGKIDPASKNLRPFNLISPEEWMARRKAWEKYDKPVVNRDGLPNHGTLNNIAIFIRFSDDPELTNSYSAIDNMFNDVSEGSVSMRSYFRAASYGAIEIPTTFYPGHNGETVISYQDTYPRSYYEPYNATTNTNGYQNDSERTEREFSLLERAVNYINANYPIPSNLNVDYDNDGYVDNVCFIVKGGVGEWSSLLWPHKWSLYGKNVYINGKRVWTFNFQLADATSYFNTSTMCHEMNHSLSAPDLYHYSYTGPDAVGIWDLMHHNAMPPQHCGAYMKMKYGHWIDEIPEITQAGTYTLSPISSATPTNIAYKIQSDDPNQYYVLEYRDNTSLFETALPGSGILVYRIDTRFEGNADYNPNSGIYDEVYIFRPGGSTSVNGDLYSAYFSSNVNRTEFSSSTSAYPFYTDGTIDNNLRIYNITSAGNTISFSYGTSSDCNPPTNIVATLVDNDVSLSWNAAANAVSYNIYRNGTLIGNTSGTTYIDSDIAYGRYSYFLKSVDANGLFSTSSETVTVSYIPEGTIFIGDGSSVTSDFLPSYSYYNYALSQQIYTAAELGEAGAITGIAFYNGGAEETRTYDFYLKRTTKSAFSSTTDWETVSDVNKVFSGVVTMTANGWTTITFDTPFAYDGISNILLVADDNSGGYTGSPHMSCRVFNAPSQAIYVYSDGTNYDPMTPPTSYSSNEYAALLSMKNQLIVTKEAIPTSPLTVTVSTNPVDGGSVSMVGRELEFDFENGLGNWTTIDADGDGYNWMLSSTSMGTGYGHNSSYDMVLSQSYRIGVGPLTPDNYLVSPQVILGGSISFYACAQDANWVAEHFGVAVSTTNNNNASAFTTIQEWTMSGKGSGAPTNVTRSGSRTQGNWYQFTVDLSEYSGMGYVAIRHFNCTDWFYLDVDDVTIVEGTMDGNVVSRVFSFGDFCTVTATPADGYMFAGWREDDGIVSTANPYTFSVTGNHNLVATFMQPIEIGESETTSNYLPSYSWYKQALSQQIYVADEIGTAGTIQGIAFYNEGAERTRSYDFYLKTTEKSSFSSKTDWITVSESDKVFSGSVTMTANAWTFITLDTPFEYNGTSNLVLVADDNSGRYDSSPYMACSAFNTSSTQAIYVYSDGTNYNPMSPPTSYGSGEYSAILSKKNHIVLGITPFQTFTKEIDAYTDNRGYYLISVPIEEVAPEDVEHMLENNYDLYAFDESQELEWINYKSGSFGLEAGKGYLYANSEDVVLSLAGVSNNGNGEVTLSKTGDGETAGWNLVGNPFNHTAYLDRDFYVMNDDGSEIVPAERDYIEPMEGVFVVAESDGEILTFSTTAPSKSLRLVLDLSGGPSTSSGTAVVDRAIVRFAEGRMLPKFQIKESSSKLFIQQDGKDYAVVNSGEEGEILVGFKAEQSGSYTLSFSSENVEFSYLHLVDCFTGADIDLLSTSNYSFNAMTTDKADRFKVVFAVERKE